MKKRNLKTLDAEIVEVYSRQLSRDSKRLTSSKYTYYPVVRYKLDGKDNLRRCNINSSSDKSFKIFPARILGNSIAERNCLFCLYFFIIHKQMFANVCSL